MIPRNSWHEDKHDGHKDEQEKKVNSSCVTRRLKLDPRCVTRHLKLDPRGAFSPWDQKHQQPRDQAAEKSTIHHSVLSVPGISYKGKPATLFNQRWAYSANARLASALISGDEPLVTRYW